MNYVQLKFQTLKDSISEKDLSVKEYDRCNRILLDFEKSRDLLQKAVNFDSFLLLLLSVFLLRMEYYYYYLSKWGPFYLQSMDELLCWPIDCRPKQKTKDELMHEQRRY